MLYVVLDRDGTLIRHIPYLHDPSKVELLPTVIAGLTRLRDSGCKLFLHTNQSGIGRGYFSLADAMACNQAMIQQIGLGSALFEEICVGSEAPDQPVRYRKPSPLFGREIINKYSVKQGAVCYIGDNVTDLLTAKNLGCHGIGVNTGVHDLRQELPLQGLVDVFPIFDTFIDAAEHVVRYNRHPHETN
jgi:D-glycero-D-manno-heptose 1,7-bisphosphate phosphatase